MKKLGIILLASAGLTGLAQGADLPTKNGNGQPAPKPDCFASFWDWLHSSASDCPLSYAGITLYGTLDVGAGYFAQGSAFTPSSDKLVYGVQKYSTGSRWQPTYNALSTSVAGIKMTENLAYGWSLIGLVEAGVNPYSGMVDNQPRTLPTTTQGRLESGRIRHPTLTAAVQASGTTRRALPASATRYTVQSRSAARTRCRLTP